MGMAGRDERNAVDAAGAASLRWRIEQQQHWRQAQAVLDGRQPSVDPDMEQLVSVAEGIRIYSEPRTSEGHLRTCKRLVEGVWQHGQLDAELELAAVVTAVAQEGTDSVAWVA
jgi:hypothetical protein